ncbi:hypothetical protein A7E75_10730 [Syntrophotalea acetylenica]|uniref:Uncharacterized protein n=1 Tax=Syntrophotalea acetylenica TaxID=29542 RepID=A0A1L3GHR9_SYNAC|nr:hypothetical protein A7E75_10730 [Syntrophotalea acetylenica]APG43508.1 hypothetical protein A6070_04735 [Syntrophotalea acetylenica]
MGIQPVILTRCPVYAAAPKAVIHKGVKYRAKAFAGQGRDPCEQIFALFKPARAGLCCHGFVGLTVANTNFQPGIL